MRTMLFIAALFMGLLLASAMTPSAYAYLTPDEVIFNEEYFYPPKPSQARERVEAQNRESAANRERVYAELEAKRKASSSSAASDQQAQAEQASDIVEHLAAIVAALQQQGGVSTFQPNEDGIVDGEQLHDAAPLTPEERRRERILERLEDRDQERLHASAWYGAEQLHSGAPLAHTGMETMVIIAGFGVAAVWTIRRAAKKGYIEVKY